MSDGHGGSTFRIAALSGSLRAQSYNSGLIRAAIEEAPAGIQITQVEGMREIPPFDVDVVHGHGPPPMVQHFAKAIRDADAVIIATPEYNYGVPGVLKNMLDWVSHPPPTNPLRYKPVALMGASIGNFGTTRGQLALRQSLLFFESYVLPKPEIYLFQAAQRFDQNSNLIDVATRELLRDQLRALRRFAAAMASIER